MTRSVIEHIAPTFHVVSTDNQFGAIADPNAPLYAFAPDVVRLYLRLLAWTGDNLDSVKLPAERCWFELRGGTEAASANVLAYSLSPGRPNRDSR